MNLISRSEAASELVAATRRLAERGWMRATSGNLSVVVATDPLSLAITASGVDKEALEVRDVVLVDSSGAALAGEEGAPSAEAALHARIVQLSAAGAVVHVHTVSSVAAARRSPSGIVFRHLEMTKALGHSPDDGPLELPVIENSQQMAVLGDRLAASYSDAVPAVVAAGHGLYAWGEDLEKACLNAEAVDWLCQAILAGD